MDKIIEKKNNKPFQHILFACDIIMLSTCCLNISYAILIDYTNYILIWFTLNTIAIIVFRNWLIFTLRLPWLQSPLNRAIKRATDIVLSMLFLITIFPLIYIIKAISTKMHHKGSVLHFNTIEINHNKIEILEFSQNHFFNHLKLSPIALHIFIGNLSVWDLKSISLCNCKRSYNNEMSNLIKDENKEDTLKIDEPYEDTEIDTSKNIYTHTIDTKIEQENEHI